MTSPCTCHLPVEEECLFCNYNKDGECPALMDSLSPCAHCGMLADDTNKDGFCGDCIFSGRVVID